MLCRFLEELCHGHLPLAGKLGLSVCSLLALCVSCLAWCRGGLPLFGSGFEKGLDLGTSVFWIIPGSRVSFRGEVGQGGLNFWALLSLSMVRLLRRVLHLRFSPASPDRFPHF